MTHTAGRVLALLGPLLLVVGWWAAPSYATATATATPASGEFCAEDAGISVVLDASGLGGEVTRSCVQTADSLAAADVFEQVGLDLTPVSTFPGAVCRVDGEPADASCADMPPADAYWGLFLAGAGTGTGDGSGDGAWDYAPVGVDELELAPGDFVGFAWQTSAEPTLPGAEPVAGEAQGASETDDLAPGEGEAPQGTPGTNADQAAGQGVEDGTPVWIFYVLVVALAVGGLVFGLVRSRRRRG